MAAAAIPALAPAATVAPAAKPAPAAIVALASISAPAPAAVLAPAAILASAAILARLPLQRSWLLQRFWLLPVQRSWLPQRSLLRSCGDPRDPGFCFCSFSDPGSRDSAAILAACNALEPAPAAIKNSDAWQRSGTRAGLQNLPLQRSWRPATFWNLPMQPSSCSAPPCLRSDPGALARSGTCLGPLATLPTYICSDPGARQRF